MKRSLLKKITIYIIVIFIGTVALSVSLSCLGNFKRTIKLTTNISISASQITSEFADNYDMMELLDNPDSVEYQYVQSVLRSICRNEGLEYLYIYIPDMDRDQVTYVVTVAADDEEHARVAGERKAGTVVQYDISDEEKNAWAGKTEGISYEYSSPNYGKVLSAYALIRDADNNPVALVGADYELSKIYHEIISGIISKMSIVLIVLIGIFCVIALFIKKKIYEPITFLFEHMRNYISNKSEDSRSFEPIRMDTNDEIQRLADFFNEMVEDVDNYVERIKLLAGEQAKSATELEVARRIQYGIIERKKEICLADDFMVSARMQSARQVGGDFYDSFLLKNGDVCVCIGDVSGKGIAAALFMVFAKTLIREKMMDIPDLDQAVTAVNLEICNSNPEGMFITAFIAVFEQDSDSFRYVNAGHNKPVLIHNGKAEFMECKTGIALGVFDDVEYEQGEYAFPDGEILYLYTDGVTEAINKEKQFFGDENLLHACSAPENAEKEVLSDAGSTPEGAEKEVLSDAGSVPEDTATDVCERAVSALKTFIGTDTEQFDDITMVVLKRHDRYLELAHDMSELDRIRQYIFAFPYDEALKKKIFLVCDEIFSNIVSYSGAEHIQLRCSKNNDHINVVFTDDGAEFNSLENNTEKEFEDFDTGGMGLMLVKKMCSDMKYHYTDGKNVLVLEFTE